MNIQLSRDKKSMFMLENHYSFSPFSLQLLTSINRLQASPEKVKTDLSLQNLAIISSQ